jgi:quinoprotein glucose dehydrogenase
MCFTDSVVVEKGSILLPLRRISISLLASGLVCLGLGCLPVSSRADEVVATAKPNKKRRGTEPDDPAEAMKKFTIAAGLKSDLVASEPLIKNISSFCFDNLGRLYVVETGRRKTTVFDVRGFQEWLDSDFALRTVDERAEFFKKTIDPENKALVAKLAAKGFGDFNHDGKVDWHDLEVESESVHLVRDTDGDGKFDHQTIFADDFKTSVSGVAAGVLARDGNVYFACIPDLWKLRDTNGDGVADERTKMASGFGVHIAFSGHDMHGLRFGPDGKVYWSIADRGSNVKVNGQQFFNPDTGAVFRCNPDGTEFEVFAYGLRNPQELAFDKYGNLWTGDNNGDGGDPARWVYVVEGADNGWTMGWQWLPKMGDWNSEKLWACGATNQAAYIVPAVAHIGHGPAGLAYYPGTGLPDPFKDHFFLCDYPGGIRSFTVEPEGAGFKANLPQDSLVNNSGEKMDGKLFWNLWPVDVDFGSEGGIYVMDWPNGWEKNSKARLYRLHDPAIDKNPLVIETKRILAEGMQKKTVEQLIALLSHPDMRVRQDAQFALAKKKEDSVQLLISVAQGNPQQLARIHALWALGQIGTPSSLAPVVPLLTDADAEIRAQAAKVLGDRHFADAYDGLRKALTDSSPRVQFFAAMGLGKLGRKEAFAEVVDLLRTQGDKDPYLRHAEVMALTALTDHDNLATAAKDSSASVRMGALLAMRRLKSSEVKTFLTEQDQRLVMESARAIYDVPIADAMPALAALISRPNLGTAVTRRILNAHFHLGSETNAVALAQFATNSIMPETLRVEALELLGIWATPPPRDRIVGLYRPIAARGNEAAAKALGSVFADLFRNGSDRIRVAAIQTASQLKLQDVDLFSIVEQTNHNPRVRVEALQALRDRKDPRLDRALRLAEKDPSTVFRIAALRLQVQSEPEKAVKELREILMKGEISEKQSAFGMLASIPGKAADDIISRWLDRVLKGNADKELQLDVLEAAARRKGRSFQNRLKQYESSFSASDDVAKYRPVLFGGNAAEGRKLFYERQEAACFRCHKIQGNGGDVGPELSGVGKRQTREYLLESIVYPNKQIAAGFDNVTIVLKNGNSYAGQVKGTNANEITINSPEDGLVKIPQKDIKQQKRGLSPMPNDLATILSKQELRNLVEFLAQQ